MYLDQYKIEGTENYDQNPCFGSPDTYPLFQEELEEFKDLLVTLVLKKCPKTFYKFGDGDWHFLNKSSVGSAAVGRRAIGKSYQDIKHEQFVMGAQLNDYYTCEIYPENRRMFSSVIRQKVDFPAEYGYGLVANKWLTKTFAGRIGLIGAFEKIELIKTLMSYEQYQGYLGLQKFNDYLYIPQRFACDDIDATEDMIAKQLANSDSNIFLVGIGHVKSALLHRLRKYSNAVFLDVGSGIDALAGIIDVDRPFFGAWTNHQIAGLDIYRQIDYLAYQGKGKHVYL